MKILVTGGAGYIGSHICLELIAQGHQVIIADNLLIHTDYPLRGFKAYVKKRSCFMKLTYAKSNRRYISSSFC